MARKQGLNSLRPKLISIAVASCFVTTTAFANPTGPTVVHGTAAIQGLGTNLVKITNSPSAIINWQSFSIGASEITRFIQQSQSSAVLNRVTGAAGVIDPSVILGALQSNGRVFLINPSGILFGAGAQIDVAGLVASSLNLSNADFLANRLKFTDVPGAGSVINQGNITTGAGGPVYLVGSAVTNNGIITSPQGEVVLAAGNSVELVSPGTPNLRVEVNAQDEEARNIGQIIADAGRVGIYAGLINNSGTIRASSAVAEGGKILLKATKEVTLESTSILDASGAGGGRIDVLAKDGGTVNVNGRLDASAPVSGDGGFIETSADAVKIADGTVVTTKAANGKTGTWLIDPTDFYIFEGGSSQSDSGIGASNLATQLADNNIAIFTSSEAYGGELGDIHVNAVVSWGSENSLTLVAHNDIYVRSSIVNSGTGDINLYAGSDHLNEPAPVVPSAVTPGKGVIDIDDATLSTGGNVLLIAGNGIFGNSPITADGLLADGGAGGVYLDNATNSVNTIAGKATGEFRFLNGKTLTVGAVGGVEGIAATGSGSAVVVDIHVQGSSGPADLKVTRNITATATGGIFPSEHDSNSHINLRVDGSYGGAVNIDGASVIATGSPEVVARRNSAYIDIFGADGVSVTGGTIRAQGGIELDGGEGYGGGLAEVNINSGSGTLGITSNSLIEALAGSSAVWNGGSARVDLGSDTAITITGSTIRVRGGDGINGGDGGYASVGVNSDTGTLAMTGNSTIEVLGGGSEARWGGSAAIDVFGATDVTITGSTLRARGGDGAEGGGSANIYVNAGTGTLGVTGNSLIEALGGASADAGWSGGSAYVTLRANSPSTVNVTGSTVRAIAGAGDNTGYAIIRVSDSDGNVNITNNSKIEADGAEGNIDIWAAGNTTISGSTLIASGRATADGYYSTGEIYVAGDQVAINNSTLTANGASGQQQYGGSAYVYIEGNQIAFGNSTFNANGGSGANGGGYADIYVYGSQVGIDNGSSLNATGGSNSSGWGGDANIDIYAYGANGVSIAGSTLQATGGAGATPAQQGYAWVDVGSGQAGGSVAISGSTLKANGQAAEIYVESDAGLTVNNNSTIAATGRNAVDGAEGFVGLFSNGDLSISGSSVSANGREAMIEVGSSGNMTASNSTITAKAMTGPNGGEGMVLVSANGAVNTGSSTLSADGRTSVDGGEGSGVMVMTNGGNATLGLLSSNDIVAVGATGSIIDGNAGANVIAPNASLQGNGGIGSLANPLETATTNLFLSASGGEIGVINSGNLVLAGLSNTGAGANAVGTSGTMVFAAPIHVSGNLALLANNGMVVEQNISSGSDLVMGSGAGTLAFDGVTVGGSNVTLSGNTVQVGLLDESTAPTVVSADNLMKVTTAANLNVLGGANDAAGARLEGTDVDLTVGTVAGFVNIHGGSHGASAQIHAGSPETITLFFPTLAAGGYFINGVENVIADGSTGFFANGSPAVLGESLKITYGGAAALPPPVQQGIDQVISSTNDQDKEPETYHSGSDPSGDGEEKKDLPVCK